MSFSPRRQIFFFPLPLFVFFAFGFLSPEAAQAVNRQPKGLSGKGSGSLRSVIDSILPEKKYKNLEVGVLAVSLDKGDTLVERNADMMLIPASVNKVFTAFVALK